MATFMQQHCDAENLNKFSFVPEGNLHLQSPPEYFNYFDTLSAFPDEFLWIYKEELKFIWLKIDIKQDYNLL